MVHADPADFDDVATFCTIRQFERAENPERYWFPTNEFFDRIDFGTEDDVNQVVRSYATEKLSLSEEKAEQFRSQFFHCYNMYFDFYRERCSYNLIHFMAIVRQIWETKAVEALGDILVHFRENENLESQMSEISSVSLGLIDRLQRLKQCPKDIANQVVLYESADIDISADTAEFVVQHVDHAAAVQLTRMYPDHFATQFNLELTSVCLHCAMVDALNEESGNFANGFNPPSCVGGKSFMKLFSGPVTSEYQRGKCVTCSHAKTVHYNTVLLPGCGTCHTCLRHSTELWDLIDQVARLELPASVKYPSHAFRYPNPPPENITWTTMPVLNRKMILAPALGPVGSALYSRLCDELLSAIHCAALPLATTHGILTMDSRPNIAHEKVNDSSSIDVPVPRLFVQLLQNGYFANAFHMIQSKYLELKKSDAAPENRELWKWLSFKKLYFSNQRAPFTSFDLVPSVSNVIINDKYVAYTHFIIRAGQTRIYSVDKHVSARFVMEILDFVEFSEQTTGANHLALVTPEVDLNLASIDFSTIQGPEAFSIVQFRKGDKLGEGKFGEVYEVTCGSMRLALKVIDLKKCSIPQFEPLLASVTTPTVSSWIDLRDNKMYMLLPRFTTNLCDYIEMKKALTSGGNDIWKIAAFRVIVAWVALLLLTELLRWQSGERTKIYHGDIHLRNVFLLLDEDGAIVTVTLGDFGLAHQEEAAPTETVTIDQSCQSSSGSLVDSHPSSTAAGHDLANLRSNVIRYMLEDIRKHLSVEELRLCGWPTRGPGIEFTIGKMRDAAVDAARRTLWELNLISVFLPREDKQVLEEYLPHFLRPDLEKRRRQICEMCPSHMRTESLWKRVKACLEAATRKQDDLERLVDSVEEVLND